MTSNNVFKQGYALIIGVDQPSVKVDGNQSQHPDVKLTGNFPIALLLGGKGIAKCMGAPDPLDLDKMAARDTGSRTINIEGGTYIEGNITVSGGDFVGRDKVINNPR